MYLIGLIQSLYTNKLTSCAFIAGVFLFLFRESRGLARFDPFDKAEIWSHDLFPNLICKNLGFFHSLKVWYNARAI